MGKMNNKRKIIICLCIAIFMMTIGYAVFSTSLIISGTANIASEWKVLFTNIEQVSKSAGVMIKNAPQASGTTATFDVGLTSPGDSIEYKITVANQGTLAAIIENIAANETGSDAVIFEISNIKTGDILDAKDTTTFNIKIMYDSNVTSQPTDLKNKLTINVGYTQYIGQTIQNNAPTLNSSVLTKLAGSTNLILSNSAGRALNNYVISGNTVQSGNPSPDTPAAIQSVGVKTDNLYYKSGTISTSNLGITISYDEKTQTYTLNGTTTGVGNIDLSVKMDIPLADGETIYYARVVDGGSVEFPSGAYLLYSIFTQENTNYIGNRVREDSATIGNSFVKTQNTLPVRGTSGLYRAYIQCLGVKGIVFNNFKIKFMISKTSPQEYEPYGYKLPISVSNGTLTNNYNIYLDEPLGCINDTCDSLDFSKKQVTRRIASKTITDMNFFLNGTDSGYNKFEATVQDKLVTNSYTTNVLSTVFKNVAYSTKTDNSIAENINNNVVRILTTKYSTAAQLNSALGNEKVYYLLSTADNQIIDLPTIYTLEGDNTLTVMNNNEVSVPIEVSYYKMP